MSKGKYDALLEERNELSRESGALARVATELSEEVLIRDREMQQLKREQQELAEELEVWIVAGMIKMELLKDGLHLILSHEILFPTASSELSETGREVLTKLVGELEQLPYQIGVLGYTDNVCRRSPRRALSLELGAGGRPRGERRAPDARGRHPGGAAGGGLVRADPADRLERHVGGPRAESQDRGAAPAGRPVARARRNAPPVYGGSVGAGREAFPEISISRIHRMSVIGTQVDLSVDCRSVTVAPSALLRSVTASTSSSSFTV